MIVTIKYEWDFYIQEGQPLKRQMLIGIYSTKKKGHISFNYLIATGHDIGTVCTYSCVQRPYACLVSLLAPK